MLRPWVTSGRPHPQGGATWWRPLSPHGATAGACAEGAGRGTCSLPAQPKALCFPRPITHQARPGQRPRAGTVPGVGTGRPLPSAARAGQPPPTRSGPGSQAASPVGLQSAQPGLRPRGPPARPGWPLQALDWHQGSGGPSVLWVPGHQRGAGLSPPLHQRPTLSINALTPCLLDLKKV